MEMLPGVCSAFLGLIAVSWLLIRPRPVQKSVLHSPLSIVTVLHVICFLGGLPVGALALLAWQWFLSARVQQHNFRRLPPAPMALPDVGTFYFALFEGEDL